MVRGRAHWWLRGVATRRRRRLPGASPRAPGTLHQHASRMGNFCKKEKWGGARLHATYSWAAGLLASTLRTFLPATVGRIASECCAWRKVDKSYAWNTRAARCALRDESHQTAWHYANSRRGERVGSQVSGGLHRLWLARTMRSPCTSPHPVVAAAAGSAFCNSAKPEPSVGEAGNQCRPSQERKARAGKSSVQRFRRATGSEAQNMRRDASYGTSWDAS